MQDLEREFAESGGQARVTDHRAHVNGAANMVRSPRLQAFDLSRETAATRDRYGRGAGGGPGPGAQSFGQGCLLARRLIEAGVTFVEVGMGGGGIRGGRVIGSTSEGGNDITNRPVGVADLYCTICHALGIDPRKEKSNADRSSDQDRRWRRACTRAVPGLIARLWLPSPLG